jgi:predicted PurR-regulated permease PerM
MPDDGGERLRTASLAICACVAAAFALYFGREFFQPLAIAALLTAVFRPVVRALERMKCPTPMAAAVVVLAVMAAIALGGFALAPPVQRWFQQAPQSLSAAEEKLARLRRPVQQVQDVAKKIEQAAQGPTTQPATPTPVAPAPSFLVRVFGTTATFVTGLSEVLLMMYLLLASGDLFVQKLIKLMPLHRDKAMAANVVDDVQTAVMRYIAATAAINLGQAVIVVLVMMLLKVPHPLMWGLLTFVLEFVPYLGAAVMIALLSVTAFATFDSLGRIVAMPLSYFVITSIQNNVVSPYAYGNRLRLNPVAVLVGVLAWWFLWGTPGAFVAVPILAAVKIVADRTDELKPLGEFLGE